jgi:SAM-dependent methyltransferase
MSKAGRPPKRKFGMASQALAYLRRGLGVPPKDDRGEFEQWQKKNPKKTFKDFFSETVEAKLRAGGAHQSLGGNLDGKVHGEVGQGFFRRFVAKGLKPEDSFVDYGCGTLRLGIHAIKYLSPGRYWGLEISDFLLDQGRELIGEKLLREKEPHLQVISPESVAAAAAAKPAVLISVRVLIHVHPNDLKEYFHNILTIIGSSGQAHVNGKWSPRETIQSSSRSWAHSIATIEETVRAEGGRLEIAAQEPCDIEGLNEKVVAGSLKIVAG